MRDKKLEEMRQDYENIKIPAELRQRVEAGIRQAKEGRVRGGGKRCCDRHIPRKYSHRRNSRQRAEKTRRTKNITSTGIAEYAAGHTVNSNGCSNI